ncbi:MAG TPA: hypothetical protein DEG44_04850, partial [Candidatus Kerfeldbacteria bacterium]|nr:hypothetical protein [Candidatus Kerfeldbacteria bacterium]
IIQASAGLDVEYIDMTISVDRAPADIEGWFAFQGLVGADVWENTNLVTDEVLALQGRLSVQHWLEQRYERKNRLYAQWL